MVAGEGGGAGGPCEGRQAPFTLPDICFMVQRIKHISRVIYLYVHISIPCLCTPVPCGQERDPGRLVGGGKLLDDGGHCGRWLCCWSWENLRGGVLHDLPGCCVLSCLYRGGVVSGIDQSALGGCYQFLRGGWSMDSSTCLTESFGRVLVTLGKG